MASGPSGSNQSIESIIYTCEVISGHFKSVGSGLWLTTINVSDSGAMGLMTSQTSSVCIVSLSKAPGRDRFLNADRDKYGGLHLRDIPMLDFPSIYPQKLGLSLTAWYTSHSRPKGSKSCFYLAAYRVQLDQMYPRCIATSLHLLG